jgi:hypothetical protein
MSSVRAGGHRTCPGTIGWTSPRTVHQIARKMDEATAPAWLDETTSLRELAKAVSAPKGRVRPVIGGETVIPLPGEVRESGNVAEMRTAE